jgi:hypothetical protein
MNVRQRYTAIAWRVSRVPLMPQRWSVGLTLVPNVA